MTVSHEPVIQVKHAQYLTKVCSLRCFWPVDLNVKKKNLNQLNDGSTALKFSVLK